MSIQQKFKAYQVITGWSDEEVSIKVTTLVAEGGWQLYGPIMITAMPTGTVFFAQALMLFEIVQTPDEPEMKQ